MNEVFERTRSGTSMADSTMMRILHSAMNRAHEKVRSKEGVVERLSEQSKFCELAITQLEACISFVQEVADCGFFTLQMRSYDKLVSDLNEVRGRLYHRLGKTEEALANQDRELVQRTENESRLRRKLDKREKQLLMLLREKSDGKEGYGFNDLKSSIDQQLEGEWNNLAGVENTEQENHADAAIRDEDDDGGDENKGSEDDDGKVIVPDQMGSEIDRLKETLDVAFVVMQNAISVSEVRHVEMQWRWTVEKETLSILFTGFVRDLQTKYESLATGTPDGRFLSVRKWTGLISDLASMHSQLTNLMGLVDHLIRTPRTTPRESPKARQEGGSPLSSAGGSNSSSPKNVELTTEAEVDAKSEEEGSTSKVAKMIETHESIIRQKSAEVSSAMKPLQSTRKDRDELKNLIQNVIESLALIRSRWDDQLGSTIAKNSLGQHLTDGAQETTRIGNRIEMEKQDTYKESTGLHNLVAEEDIMKFVLRCMVKDSQQSALDQEVESLIKELVVATMIKDMMNELNNLNKDNGKIETTRVDKEAKLQSLIAEDVMKLVLTSMVHDSHRSALDREVESCITKAVFTAMLKGMMDEVNCTIWEHAKDWNDSKEGYEAYNHLREEITKTVGHETLRSNESIYGIMRNQYQEQKDVDRYSHDPEDVVGLQSTSLESLVKEEVYHALLKEMTSANLESLIEKEVHGAICLDTLKEAHNQITGFESKVSEDHAHKEERSCVDSISSPSGNNNSFIQKLDSLLQYLEEEVEGKMKEISSRMEGGRKQDLDYIREQLQISEDEINFSSIRDRFEKALQQLGTCKVILEELNHGQANEIVSNSDDDDDDDDDDDYKEVICSQVDHVVDRQECKEYLPFCLKATEVLSELVASFEHELHQKIHLKLVRFESLKSQLESMGSLVTSLKKKEQLYKLAFIKRCENLQKAESEVDVLGDQVDGLLNLLDKVYNTLEYCLPQLQQHSGVLQILTLIKKELNRNAGY